MYYRASYFIAAFVFAPAMAAAQGKPFTTSHNSSKPLNSIPTLDNGTGPYGSNPQTGVSPKSNSTTAELVSHSRLLASALRAIQASTTARDIDRVWRDVVGQAREVARLAKEVTEGPAEMGTLASTGGATFLIEADFMVLKDALDRVEKGSPGSSSDLTVAEAAATKLAADLQSLDKEERADHSLFTTSMLKPTSQLKMGEFLSKQASYQFDTFTYSPGESQNIQSRWGSAFYLAATQLIQTNTSGLWSSRLAIGLLAGDPDQLVFGATTAAYISPYIGDTQLSLAVKLGHYTDPKGKYAFLNWNHANQPRLVDHVRPGDIWLGTDTRWLSSPGFHQNARAYETSVIYAFTGGGLADNSIPTSTLTMTYGYCDQPAYGLTDCGIEARYLLAKPLRLKTPLFLSARFSTNKFLKDSYGMTDTMTVALEGTFGG